MKGKKLEDEKSNFHAMYPISDLCLEKCRRGLDFCCWGCGLNPEPLDARQVLELR